jgi:uncharacterized damage-inducible protein DinB
MKAIFQALAKYNSSVNQSIIEIIEPLSEEKIMTITKAYFPSIFETLLHLFFSDLFWLKRFREVFQESNALSVSKLVSLDGKNLRKKFETDYTKFFQRRKQADEVIRQFIEEIDEAALNSVITYKNFKGDDVEKELWKILLQWFNHQTHHRGQISVLLDMIGVNNDYSSLLTRI